MSGCLQILFSLVPGGKNRAKSCKTVSMVPSFTIVIMQIQGMGTYPHENTETEKCNIFQGICILYKNL